jgi:uncharacterized membrane protein SirB2
MIEFYPQIKAAHVGMVFASGALFALRGALVLGGSRWGMAAPVRWLSYSIDTVLFTAAMMLLVVLHMNPAGNPWLALKLVLLVVYVVVGSFALKRGRTPRVRAACYVAALLLYGWMIGVARAHHPLSWLRWYGWL